MDAIKGNKIHRINYVGDKWKEQYCRNIVIYMERRKAREGVVEGVVEPFVGSDKVLTFLEIYEGYPSNVSVMAHCSQRACES